MFPRRSSAVVVRFGTFEAEIQSGELRKRGVKVALQDQPFRVLTLLLESPGELVTRQALRETLWPDNTFVDFERSLNTAVAKLRQSLGDSAENPRFIETVARRGYRFVAPIEKFEVPEEPAKVAVPVFEDTELRQHDPVEIRAEPGNRPPRALPRSRLLLALALAAAILRMFLANTARRESSPNARFDQMRVKRLTSTGETVAAAVSPDGRYVVYAVAADGKQSLWLHQTAISSAIEIVPPEEVVYFGLTFSRNGNLIYCSRYGKNRPADGAVYELASLGGHFRKLISGIAGPLSVSPNGGHFAFVRWNLAAGETYIMLTDADGTNERWLATRKLNRSYREALAWSPDGQWIATGVTEDQVRHSVVVMPVAGGPERLISHREWTDVKQVAWMPDGKSLIVVAAAAGSLDAQLWRIAYAEGDVHRLTNDSSDYDGVSLTADGETLVTVARAAPSSIWVTGTDNPGTARKLVAGTSDYNWVLGLDWTEDGRVIFSSKTNENVSVWTIPSDGGTPRQIVLPSDFVPWTAVASNGTIAFASGRPSNLNVWIADMDGGNARQITHGGSNGCPDISRDGRTIVYNAVGVGLSRVGTSGDNPMLLARNAMCFPRISPDGKSVAYSYFDDPSKTPKIYIAPLSGGGPTVSLNIPWDPPNVCMCKRLFQWAPDGQAITYSETDDGVSNIWSQPLDGSSPTQVTRFTSDQIFAFAWSKNGQRLALSRGNATADAIMLTGFR